jgi:hypothetical protein
VVEAEGFTVMDPMRVLVVESTPWMATELALLTFQERVEVPLGATMVGEAVKEVMEGRFSTFTVIEAVEVLLELSVASAQRVVEPLAVELVFQETE